MIQPHYWCSYSKIRVGIFRGDAAAHFNQWRKVPKLTESHSVSITDVFLFFFNGEADQNITNGRRANCSHPLSWVYAFMYFFFFSLNFGSATVVFSSHPHIRTPRVSLQLVWLVNLKQFITEEVEVMLLNSAVKIPWANSRQEWQEQDQIICDFSSF